MPVPRARAAASVWLAVVCLTSGCGLLGDAAEAGTEPVPPAPSTTVPAPLPAPEPVEVARATLADRHDGTEYAGTLQVTRSEPVAGPPPMRGWFPEDCDLPVDGPARTTTVDVTFADTSRRGMATLVADVELRTAGGGALPAGAALFVESGAPGVRWCQDGTTSPTADRLGVGSGVGTVTTVSVYVVSRDGAPLTDVVLRISGLRNGIDPAGPWDTVTAVSGNCPGDPAALCVPLG